MCSGWCRATIHNRRVNCENKHQQISAAYAQCIDVCTYLFDAIVGHGCIQDFFWGEDCRRLSLILTKFLMFLKINIIEHYCNGFSGRLGQNLINIHQ